MLCDVCLDIFRGTFPRGTTKHHGSIESLRRSALDNCDICGRFRDNFLSMLPPGFEGIQVPTQFKMSSHEDTSAMVLEFTTTLPFNTTFTLPIHKQECKVFCEPTDEDSKTHDLEKPYDYSDWTASITCARNWLAECLENHSDCPGSRSSERTINETSHTVVGPTTYLPTRLLEIGEPEPNKVRLRLSSELDSTTSKYATLSHCWGESQTLRLTSRSIQHFKDGVSVSELAKTFQDAIHAAQLIGVKLLWIDSFCILQDSKEDWQQEAGLMSHVYRNSFLNIAATIAVDSDVGFFSERASTVEPYVVQTTWTDRPNGSYYVYKENYWFDNFYKMPLNNRAWVFQETTLAPRALHFCGTQMFWVCHGLKACETWPKGVPQHVYIPLIKGTNGPAAAAIFGSKSTNSTEPLHISTEKNAPLSKTSVRALWTELVREYSTCDLTFPSDKLVAISGVARHMEQVLDIEYCAGLWSFDLIMGLAWFVLTTDVLEHIFPENIEPIPYRAPSWSWASLRGPIVMRESWHAECQPLANIISCDVKTTTGNRTGAVINASMQVSGYLATITLHPDFGMNRRYPDVGKNYDIYCDGKWKCMYVYDFEFDRRPPSFRLHCLPIFVANDGTFWALLLTPTQATRGHFRRVGMFGRDRLALSSTIQE